MKQNKRLSEASETLYDYVEKSHKKADLYTESRNIVSCFVMAPVMYEYVKWVLQEAVKTKKQTLYFLARDGYSMYQVAKRICAKNSLHIKCRYLYCSRYALRSAQYLLMGDESLDYICLGGIDVTFDKLMYRAGLYPEEIDMIARICNYAKRRQVPLSRYELGKIKMQLRECSEFMELVERHAKEHYPAVCAYLRQEGLLESDSYAIVDSGWTGSMQKSIQQLIFSMGYRISMEGYYFGLYKYPKAMDPKRYHCYYFEPDKGIRRKAHFSNSLFECIYSAPDGMTLEYGRNNSCYVPIFEKQENPNKKEIMVSTDRLCAYADIMLNRFPDDMETSEKERGILAEKLFHKFMGHPTVDEAKLYGNYIFCDDVRGEEHQTVAAKLNYREIKENRLLHKGMNLLLKKETAVRESAWMEGSIVLAEKPGRRSLFACTAYKYILYMRQRMK